ncbi:hypothetical protein FGI27_003120 [Escherichia coli]|nr:hypothetical protein [Escherichia coli]ELW1089617.1 hypothetical protein [Escherichia coli]
MSWKPSCSGWTMPLSMVLLEKVMVMAGSEIYRLHAVGSENGGDGDAFVREEREIMRVMRQALDGENG